MARILVADDERGILDLMERVLGRRGHEVETFADGASAIEAIETGDYDLVISDMRMPLKTGLDVLAAAKARRASLPVIIVSASTEPEDRAQAELLGVYLMLHKPVDLAYLLTIVESAVGGGAPPAGVSAAKEGAGAAGAGATAEVKQMLKAAALNERSNAPAAAASTSPAPAVGLLVRVVEREACLSNLLGWCLRKQGFRVTGAATGGEAAIAIVGSATAIGAVRRDAPRATIIALHAAGDADEAVAVLDAGADVALPRPFEPEVLFAHVRAASRRAAAAAPAASAMPAPSAPATPAPATPASGVAPPGPAAPVAAAPAAGAGAAASGEATQPASRPVTRSRLPSPRTHPN